MENTQVEVKAEKRTAYKQKYLTARGWALVATSAAFFFFGMFLWTLRGNMALQHELHGKLNNNITMEVK